jgi:hypothetical protein
VIGLLKSAQRNNPSLLAGFALADSLPTAVLLTGFSLPAS